MLKRCKSIRVIAVLLVVASLLTLCCACGASKTEITVEVTHGDGSKKTFTVKTDLDTLGEALVEDGLVEGHNDTYGLYIDTVDGETASADDNCAWVFTKGGEMVETAADSTPIADGDPFEFYITTW